MLQAEQVAHLVGDHRQQVHAAGGRAGRQGAKVVAGPAGELLVEAGRGIDEPAVPRGVEVERDDARTLEAKLIVGQAVEADLDIVQGANLLGGETGAAPGALGGSYDRRQLALRERRDPGTCARGAGEQESGANLDLADAE